MRLNLYMRGKKVTKRDGSKDNISLLTVFEFMTPQAIFVFMCLLIIKRECETEYGWLPLSHWSIRFSN